jgi:YHS domain-containing protein
MMRLLGMVIGAMVTIGTLASGVRAEPAAQPGHAGPLRDRAYVCMLDENVLSTPGVAYVHQGKTYYTCCDKCRARFASNAESLTHAIDPVTGQRVDKAEALVYAFAGHGYYLAHEDSVRTFAADPARYVRDAYSTETAGSCGGGPLSTDSGSCQ